jgi:hypothetical protein
MPPRPLTPPFQAVLAIRRYCEARSNRTRPRPYAKEICAVFGISETTLRKWARRVGRGR